MTAPLGCVNEYAAILHTRGGAHAVADLAPLVSVEWQRRLNEQSVGSVVLAKDAVGARCCAALAECSPWAHELSIYRGQQLVWQGPVQRPVETRTAFTIEAPDVTGWFDRRAVAQSYTYTNLDAVKIARRLLGDAFATNDPGIRAWFTFTDGTNASEQESIAKVDIVGEQFSDLVSQGMDYTTVGRRVIMCPPGWQATSTPRAVTTLTDEHLGGGVTVSTEGSAMATRVYNHSSAFEPGDAIGSAGGPDAFYGLVEVVEELNQATISQTNMNAIAKTSLRRGYPAPVVVRVDDDASLHPQAPVSVTDLVCGVRIDVLLTTGWCRPVRQAMRLVSVTGLWDATGERISISLEQLGGGLEPTAAAEVVDG